LEAFILVSSPFLVSDVSFPSELLQKIQLIFDFIQVAVSGTKIYFRTVVMMSQDLTHKLSIFDIEHV